MVVSAKLYVLFLICGLASGCIAASKQTRVIVGFDYNDAKKLLSRRVSGEIFVEAVRKQPDEKGLIISFSEMDGAKRYRVAAVTSNDVTVTAGSVPKAPAFLVSIWGEVPAIPSPDEEHWLLYKWGPSFVVSRSAPSNVLFSTKLQMSPERLFLFNGKGYIVGPWGTGKETTIKVVEWSLAATNSVKETDIPWAGHCYDVDANNGHILLTEKRHFMAGSFDYNVVNGKRNRVSFAREYMFFLPRDFAEQLQKILPHMVIAELSD